ncbi:MAG: nucleotidyltransferase domain-containing protein [Candidatus Aenigmarchaeota archaeon]|nr:nucleotidyltransferase domain-containing protein [Candidatus Aenigmarchaeota archaeon]
MLQIHREILNEFRHINAGVILYGSVATGSYDDESDIDLAIISNEKRIFREADKIADKILLNYGKVVMLVNIRPEELKMRQKWPFYENIIKNGVMISRGKRADKRTGKGRIRSG